MKAAQYSTGNVFTYTYDAVGNRLTQTTLTNTTVYTYDIANRLINVGAITQTWDNNGNLLNDGVFTYTYDSANRLVTLKQGATLTYTYNYNGLGDRVKQVVNGVPTTYTLDLNAGLTQVLADGTNTYLYGNGRIAQYAGTTPAYFLPDALGSVRQLTNSAGQVTLAKSYQPYGSVLSSAGTGTTSYAFAGEWQDATNLIFLRARFYGPQWGRFLTADSWPGNHQQPLTLNKWNYSLSNPVNYTDPSGHVVCLYGVDPRTGACKSNPLGSLLPPGIAGVLGNQPVLSPQQALVVLVTLGLVCAVEAYNLLTQARPVTWQDLSRLPEARATVVPPFPRFLPQATATSEPGKHITLGRDRVNGQTAIVNFTYQLQKYLGTKEVYYYKDWQKAGLTSFNSQNADDPAFGLAFSEVTARAIQIHFNLDGIDDPNGYAQTYGSSGKFPPGPDEFATAIELYLIRKNGLCSKTMFYRGGSTWGELRPVPEEKSEFCGDSEP